MRNYIATIVLGLLCLTLSAQYVNEDTLSMPKQRNAIGVNLTSLTSVLMSASPSVPRLGLMYKRNLTPNRTLRLYATADILSPDPSANDIGTLVAFSDTSLTFYTKSSSEHRVAMRGGFEWSHPTRKVTPVYGVDVIAGYRRLAENNRLTTYAEDTSTVYFAADLNRYMGEQPKKNVLTEDYFVGLDFTIGWRFRIKEHWDFIAQFSPEFYVSVDQKVTAYEGTSPGSIPGSTGYLELNLRMVDVMLFYRF